MPGPVACTIVANNYLAYARVFTRSFLEHHPQGRVCVLVVDRPDPKLRYDDEPFAVVFVEDLGIPDFLPFAFRYSILELNTAVKPFVLRYLHQRWDLDRACYFDPDILVLAPLAELYDRLGQSDVVLTPHVTAPIEDGLIPGERDFLLSGIYNLGFLGIAFNERTLPFLDWWHRRLYRECHHAVERGLFVDQRWMDFTPALLERVHVLRDPGYNVAYWNLVHRTVGERDGGWSIGDRPLRFFHFSGLLPDQPEQISRYQNRFTLAQRPDLEPLFRLYGQRLADEGRAALEHLPYAYGRFANGASVPPVARRLLQQADPQAKRWSDPFATSGGDPFLDWLRRSDETSILPLPRVALAIWDQRPDLQQVFPRPVDRDRLRFAEWFVEHAAENLLDESLVGPVTAALGRRAARGPSSGASLGAEVEEAAWQRLAATGHSDFRDLDEDEIAVLAAEAGVGSRATPLVPRLAVILHAQRADLQNIYPEPLGTDRAAFARWFATYGRLEYDLRPELFRPVLRSMPLRTALAAEIWWYRQRWRKRRQWRQWVGRAGPSTSLAVAGPRLESTGTAKIARPGINVVGWAAAPTGVGEACRGTLVGLEHARIPHALWSLGRSASDEMRSGAAGDIGGHGLPFEVTLLHVNADMTEIVLGQLPQALLAGCYRIGYWFWELAHLPLAFAAAFRHLDELWAPSRFCLDAFRPLAPVPLLWMPPAVAPPTEQPADRWQLGIPDGRFLFLSVFDALSVPERKNPLGLLDAFARAVASSSRPLHLLLKVNHLPAVPQLARRLRAAAAGLPVTLLADPLSRAETNALTAACDAYVSLHRSEGLGLPLIEAMYLGKPVVATGYGGVTDFLDETTGWVVRHRLVPITEPCGPYPVGAVWAEPDVDAAAAAICSLAMGATDTAERTAAARRRVTELYAPAAAAERLGRELARITGRATADSTSTRRRVPA